MTGGMERCLGCFRRSESCFPETRTIRETEPTGRGTLQTSRKCKVSSSGEVSSEGTSGTDFTQKVVSET